MDQIPHRVLLFDRFALDLTRGSLRGPDQDIDLRPKAFEVLRHLAENAGRLVPKDELYQAVWPNIAVTDDSLVQCIRELRDRLGDDEHRLIKTVHRRGYLLDAPVTVGVQQQSLAGAWARDTEPVPTHAGRADLLRGNGGLPVGSRDWRGWTIGSTILLLTLLTAAAQRPVQSHS
jgi:DNA-binding winged helix-turn-helix (wHTH) protein